MSTSQNQESYWREHLAKAEKHAVSQAAYCREAGVDARKLYAIRERLKTLVEKSRIPKAIARPAFASVNVMPSAPAKCQVQLPDARWVADFIFHLMRVTE
jgi:hypothetical protein